MPARVPVPPASWREAWESCGRCCASADADRSRRGGMTDGSTEAPYVGVETRQAPRARRAAGAPRDCLPAVRRADASPPPLPALRAVPRPQGGRGRGRLTLHVACLFPGQGSQRVGMGRDLAADFAVARRTFEEADESLSFGLSRLCFDGPAETLALTEYAQPAILATSVAVFRALAETTGLVPLVLAGHSLGEWSALVVSGALAFGDAVRGVRERGRLMQAAVPRGVGAMAAVMGLDVAAVTALCAEAAGSEVVAPANLNGGGQIVVAGHATAVDRLVRLAADRQARAQRLDVSAPFHCALMAPAADGVARFLTNVALHDPQLPVVTSVAARPVRDRADVAALLVEQVTAPVRWEETMAALRAFQPSRALEVGPGRVLTGLARRLWPELPCQSVGDAAGVAKATEALR